jgi:hypothetical protein
MPKMNKTMAKMLHAQTSIIAAKLLSATRPLPRLDRKSRIGDNVAPAAAAAAAAAADDAAGGFAGGDGTGNGELVSLSGVIRVEDTILFS